MSLSLQQFVAMQQMHLLQISLNIYASDMPIAKSEKGIF
jgi:hypothetical protein